MEKTLKPILDANVIAKWFIEEKNTDRAIEIRDEFLDIRKPEVPGSIHKMVRSSGITFYDAAYVALAKESDCKLITADERLQKRSWNRCSGGTTIN